MLRICRSEIGGMEERGSKFEPYRVAVNVGRYRTAYNGQIVFNL